MPKRILKPAAILLILTLSYSQTLWAFGTGLNPSTANLPTPNSNNYVVITGITQDTITYVDPGAGPDKNNQIETISKASFLKGWKGNVTAASALLNPVI